MIHLEVHAARTWYDGHKKELRRMFHALRVIDKQAKWKAFRILKRAAFFHGYLPEEKRAKREQIEESVRYIKFYDARSACFNSGLLPRVLRYLKKRKIEYDVRDKRKRNPLKEHKFNRVHFHDKVEVRSEQIKVIQEALRQGRGILHCATNFGKSEVAIAICHEFLRATGKVPRVLYLAHRIQLAKQMEERTRKHLGDEVPVKMIGGGHKRIPRRGIVAATVQTADLMLSDPVFREFLRKADLFFIDELQVNKAWQATNVASYCSAPMRFGLSGTIQESNKVKMMHYTGLTGPVIARVRNKELVEKGRSARPHIRFVEVKANEISEGTRYQDAYRDGVVDCDARNRLVAKEAIRYIDKGIPTLITVARIHHGLALLAKLKRRIDVPVEFISGSTPIPVRKKMMRRFEKGKISALVVSPIFDSGVDVPGGVGAWVNAAGGVGWELTMQRMGRVLRRRSGDNRVLITDFCDKHNSYLMKHSVARLKHYYKEEIATFEFIS